MTLYFVGCTTAYFTPNVAKAAVKVFEKAEIKLNTLAENEVCCGFPLYSTGQIKSFQKIAKENIETFREYDGPIVTTCPSCYRTLKELYGEILKLNKPLNVIDFPDYALKLIKEGKIKPKKLEVKVTYHDPCELGRKLSMYEPARKLIQAIPGVKLIEMARSKEGSWCCGAGGVIRIYDTKMSVDIAATRIVRDVAPLNVDYLVTSCPACIKNLMDGVTVAEALHDIKPIKVIDVAELLAMAIE